MYINNPTSTMRLIDLLDFNGRFFDYDDLYKKMSDFLSTEKTYFVSEDLWDVFIERFCDNFCTRQLNFYTTLDFKIKFRAVLKNCKRQAERIIEIDMLNINPLSTYKDVVKRSEDKSSTNDFVKSDNSTNIYTPDLINQSDVYTEGYNNNDNNIYKVDTIDSTDTNTHSGSDTTETHNTNTNTGTVTTYNLHSDTPSNTINIDNLFNTDNNYVTDVTNDKTTNDLTVTDDGSNTVTFGSANKIKSDALNKFNTTEILVNDYNSESHNTTTQKGESTTVANSHEKTKNIYSDNTILSELKEGFNGNQYDLLNAYMDLQTDVINFYLNEIEKACLFSNILY